MKSLCYFLICVLCLSRIYNLSVKSEKSLESEKNKIQAPLLDLNYSSDPKYKFVLNYQEEIITNFILIDYFLNYKKDQNATAIIDYNICPALSSDSGCPSSTLQSIKNYKTFFNVKYEKECANLLTQLLCASKCVGSESKPHFYKTISKDLIIGIDKATCLNLFIQCNKEIENLDYVNYCEEQINLPMKLKLQVKEEDFLFLAPKMIDEFCQTVEKEKDVWFDFHVQEAHQFILLKYAEIFEIPPQNLYEKININKILPGSLEYYLQMLIKIIYSKLPVLEENIQNKILKILKIFTEYLKFQSNIQLNSTNYSSEKEEVAKLFSWFLVKLTNFLNKIDTQLEGYKKLSLINFLNTTTDFESMYLILIDSWEFTDSFYDLVQDRIEFANNFKNIVRTDYFYISPMIKINSIDLEKRINSMTLFYVKDKLSSIKNALTNVEKCAEKVLEDLFNVVPEGSVKEEIEKLSNPNDNQDSKSNESKSDEERENLKSHQHLEEVIIKNETENLNHNNYNISSSTPTHQENKENNKTEINHTTYNQSTNQNTSDTTSKSQQSNTTLTKNKDKPEELNKLMNATLIKHDVFNISNKPVESKIINKSHDKTVEEEHKNTSSKDTTMKISEVAPKNSTDKEEIKLHNETKTDVLKNATVTNNTVEPIIQNKTSENNKNSNETQKEAKTNNNSTDKIQIANTTQNNSDIETKSQLTQPMANTSALNSNINKSKNESYSENLEMKNKTINSNKDRENENVKVAIITTNTPEVSKSNVSIPKEEIHERNKSQTNCTDAIKIENGLLDKQGDSKVNQTEDELKKKQEQKEKEEAELKKKKEQEEAELKNKKEQEEAELKNKKEQEEAELKKKKEQEESELKKKKEQEEAELKKKKEQEEAELKKKKEQEEAELKKKKEQEEAELKKKKEQEEAELKKKKEQEEAENIQNKTLPEQKEAEKNKTQTKKKPEFSKKSKNEPKKADGNKINTQTEQSQQIPIFPQQGLNPYGQLPYYPPGYLPPNQTYPFPPAYFPLNQTSPYPYYPYPYYGLVPTTHPSENKTESNNSTSSSSLISLITYDLSIIGGVVFYYLLIMSLFLTYIILIKVIMNKCYDYFIQHKYQLSTKNYSYLIITLVLSLIINFLISLLLYSDLLMILIFAIDSELIAASICFHYNHGKVYGPIAFSLFAILLGFKLFNFSSLILKFIFISLLTVLFFFMGVHIGLYKFIHYQRIEQGSRIRRPNQRPDDMSASVLSVSRSYNNQ